MHSVLAFYDVTGQIAQWFGRAVEGFQRLQCLIAQFQRVGFGGIQAEQRRIGRLVAGDIRALAFAEGGRVAFDVEDVILYLKRQADCLSVALQGLQFGVARTGAGEHPGARWLRSGRRSCAGA